MTLLDEYQALPKPDLDSFRAPELDEFGYLDACIDHRDAVIRLLTKALRKHIPECEDVHHEPWQRHNADEPCPVTADLEALLAAVERDFPQEQGNG